MSSTDLRIGRGAAELETAYRRHGEWLLTFLKRRFGASRAEDLLQEAIARSAAGAAEIRSPRAFLATVALRAAADGARREAGRPAVCELDEALDAPVLPEQFEAVLLKQLLRELPRPVREVYLLCRVAGFTYAEAGERLGVSVKRVEARMTEAHKRFAALMRD